uniref:Uncharacterized protein n=1 Tax=Globodera rostochiensis TaxID=31243 RepID=A0A914HKB8_GLORO
MLAAPSTPYERTSDDLMNSEPDSNADKTTIQLVNQAKTSDPNERLAAVSGIRNLLWKNEKADEFFSIGVLPVLVNCLESADEKLLVEAAGALANIVDRKTRGETMSYDGYFDDKMDFAEAVVVPLLVNLLQSENLEVRKQTVRALASIAYVKACEVVKARAVPLLVNLLQTPDMDLCENTVLALRDIAYDKAREVVEAGAVPPLVKLLQSPNMVLCENTAWTLKNIAGASDDLGLAVIEAGALPPLLNLLKSQNKYVCEEASLAIGNIIEQFPHLYAIDVEHIQIMKREKVIELIEKCGGLRKIKQLKTKESKLVLKMIEKQQSSKLD